MDRGRAGSGQQDDQLTAETQRGRAATKEDGAWRIEDGKTRAWGRLFAHAEKILLKLHHFQRLQCDER